MIVWQGVGAYAFVIPFFVWLATLLLGGAVLGSESSKAWGQELGGLSLLISAALVYWLAQRLARRPSRTLIDKETGKDVVLREAHTIFYIPMRYLGIPVRRCRRGALGRRPGDAMMPSVAEAPLTLPNAD